MPKTDNPLTKAKTSPGVSFTIPFGKLGTVLEDPDQDMFSYVVAVDAREANLIAHAARELAAKTFPGFRGAITLPIATARGRTTLLAHGKFAPIIRDAEGRALTTVTPGAVVSMRVMLKIYRTAEGMQLAAFPSRLDVQAKSPILARKTVRTETPQLPPEPPAAPVIDPRSLSLAERRKLAQRAGCTLDTLNQKKLSASPSEFWDWIAIREAKVAAKAAKGLPKVPPAPFTKATWARHRAALVQERAPANVQSSPTPRKPARQKVAETQKALPSNVIAFPLDRIRRA